MENREIQERYDLSMERIREIAEETGAGAPFCTYFQKTARFIARIEELYKELSLGKWDNASLEELEERNKELYGDLLQAQYEESYANPVFAVKSLGEGYGQLLSFLYMEVRGMIVWAFERRMEDIVVASELFLEIYGMFGEETPSVEELKESVYWYVSDYSELFLSYRVREQLDPSLTFARDIICESDLSDPRYLYRFGEYISENELGVSRFLAALPQEQIDAMAFTFTEGYRMGFVNAGIDLTKKKTVNIRYCLGFERIVKAAIEGFEKLGLKSIIYREASHSANRRPQGNPGYGVTGPNKQAAFDHKEDAGLYLDKKLSEHRLSVLHGAYETYKELASVHAGPAVMEIFGEKPFLPRSCKEAAALSEKQQELSVWYNSQSGRLVNQYIPGDERSFTIIAYPIPEIGKEFPEIFAETVKINTLDYKLYEGIQQKLIDALDAGVSVHIKGAGKNKTDLRVQLWERQSAEETIFENCVADVNIPVGEVFTSPKLNGTNGTLHVSEVYLNELKYLDLEVQFTDGCISDYSCKNFEDEAENRKYIKSNVLFNHETLPMGEFAIGTNTTAYVMAEKYGIASRLPILIAEKMGPHFAVGDTCFSWSEDTPTFNPDGKRMIAKDNEYSLKRKEDISKAYFNCHTDITIPYDELAWIRVEHSDGSFTSLIENGRFVLEGTGELNTVFPNFPVDKDL